MTSVFVYGKMKIKLKLIAMLIKPGREIDDELLEREDNTQIKTIAWYVIIVGLIIFAILAVVYR